MEPDRLAAALACLDREALTRLSRSLAWNARRSCQQGRPARAAWQDVVQGLVDGERAARDGSARVIASPLTAPLKLPERDRVVLACQYGALLHDVEGHALRPVAELYAVLADELRRAVSSDRAVLARTPVMK